SLLFYCYPPPPFLPSFPTRRSSDLIAHRTVLADDLLGICGEWGGDDLRPRALAAHPDRGRGADLVDPQAQVDEGIAGYAQVLQRSEEHTSELQSRFDLVCRLLLEKK